MPAVVVGGQRREVFVREDQWLEWLEGFTGPLARHLRLGDVWRRSEPQCGVHRRQSMAQSEVPNDDRCRSVDPRENRGDPKATAPRPRGRHSELAPAGDRRHDCAADGDRHSAVNLADGAVLWEDPLEDPLGYFLRFADAERKKAAAEILAHGLARRLWEDVSFGTMTSDGRLVFGLECGTFDLGPEQQAMVILPNGRRQLDPGMLKKYNTLTAYRREDGKDPMGIGRTICRRRKPSRRGILFGASVAA